MNELNVLNFNYSFTIYTLFMNWLLIMQLVVYLTFGIKKQKKKIYLFIGQVFIFFWYFSGGES